ncbi:unnamed protein product [Schistosoma mattheei]|uniref:Uncharacterized protein n=1 Tax=Schistosoma mattheei TaxID=31246 RepID=A0A183PAF2_9TREM|nr:unnamed protein product [Schistosoma mattheei]
MTTNRIFLCPDFLYVTVPSSVTRLCPIFFSLRDSASRAWLREVLGRASLVGEV